MFDWNDLRYFLAVARSGSTIAAAKALGLSQSTVQRRLALLERQLGCALVERHRAGYRLTALGAALRPAAELVAESVAAFERQLASSDKAPVGVLRLTCPEALLDGLVTPLVERFHQRNPGLRVDLLATERFLDLAKGEAEIAIRGGVPNDSVLIGRKIADNPWAVYASRGYIERHGKPERPEDINRHAIVAFGDGIAHLHLAGWLKQVAPRATIAARSQTVIGLMLAAKSGAGITILPAQLGDPEPELVRVIEGVPELMSGVYMLVHPDLRNTPRVRAFLDFVVAEMADFRPLLTGTTARRNSGSGQTVLHPLKARGGDPQTNKAAAAITRDLRK
jgi:DNA-binding transcriptional LysR family regulator